MVLFVLWAASHVARTGQLPFLRRECVWSVAIYQGSTPWDLKPLDQANTPAITAADVDDVPALFVADPFMVEAGQRWYMFVEVLNQDTKQGDIGLASSEDGINWDYEQIVLDEPFHLSYPSVFQVGEKWYMIPESCAKGEVRLYEAEEFPRRWKFTKTLLNSSLPADPTLFQHQDKWWMLVGTGHTHDSLRLYFADDFQGPWTEHPQSPVIQHDADNARPGGSIVQYNDKLYRFAQDCAPRYGNQLRCFEITKLTPTEYAESQVGEASVLQAAGTGWNAAGMHHADVHRRSDGTWHAVVDGHRKDWNLYARP